MNIEGIKPIQPIQPNKKGSETGPEKREYSNSDTAEFSSNSITKALILKSMSNQDAQREKKIERLKKEISECRYEINDKMMDCIVASLLLNL